MSEEVEARILAVTREARAPGALVPARWLWDPVDRLIDRGFSRAQIARWLGRRQERGHKVERLDFLGPMVRWESVVKVRRMVALLKAGKLGRDRLGKVEAAKVGWQRRRARRRPPGTVRQAGTIRPAAAAG